MNVLHNVIVHQVGHLPKVILHLLLLLEILCLRLYNSAGRVRNTLLYM